MGIGYYPAPAHHSNLMKNQRLSWKNQSSKQAILVITKEQVKSPAILVITNHLKEPAVFMKWLMKNRRTVSKVLSNV
jgi:hypothetical protein